MSHDAEYLGAVPFRRTQGSKALKDQPFSGPRRFLLGDVKGARCFGEVGVEEVAENANGEADDATDDKEPLPACMPQYAVEVFVCFSLKVARKHLGYTGSGILEGRLISACDAYPSKEVNLQRL
jgi:hypothetical protein